jgi:HK97 family phage prohead protease
MLRQITPHALRAVAERTCRAVLSSGLPGRDGLVVDVHGIDIGPYRSNPIVLLQHSQDAPIARCWPLSRDNGKLEGIITFPPAGVSANADEAYGLVRSGILNATSIGFEPGEQSRPDRDGVRTVRSCVLYEVSLVSVPADVGAVITERSVRSRRRDHLGPSIPRTDLGHRLNDVEVLSPRRVRSLIAAGLRYGVNVRPEEVGPLKPAWSGGDPGEWARRMWRYQWQRQQRSAGL